MNSLSPPEASAMSFDFDDSVRLSIKGERVLVVYLPGFMGTKELELPQYFAQRAQQNGFGFETFSWPEAMTSAREIHNVRIYDSILRAEAFFRRVAEEISQDTKIILMGSSVATTAVLRVAKEHADRIHEAIINGTGWDLENNMINPLLGTDPERRAKRRAEEFLRHPVFAPAHDPKKKAAYISWDELNRAKCYQVNSDQEVWLDGMPAMTFVCGDKDPHIPIKDAEELRDHIVVGKGETATRPHLIVAEGVAHDLKTPEELAILGGVFDRAYASALALG